MMEYIIHNLFSTEAGVVWLVLKWILVVLAAGFVGQFGKALATYLMRRTRQPREPSLQSLPEAGSKGALPESPALQQIPSDGQEKIRAAPATPAAEHAGRREEEKKEMKAQAKQQKKALKSLKKFFK
jgi:hypothetical protein